MKKQYQKPMVKLETFQLNEYIAGDCAAGVVINTYGTTGCTKTDGSVDWYYSNLGVFGNDCSTNANDSAGDGYCYHTPTAGELPVFSS